MMMHLRKLLIFLSGFIIGGVLFGMIGFSVGVNTRFELKSVSIYLGSTPTAPIPTITSTPTATVTPSPTVNPYLFEGGEWKQSSAPSEFYWVREYDGFSAYVFFDPVFGLPEDVAYVLQPKGHSGAIYILKNGEFDVEKFYSTFSKEEYDQGQAFISTFLNEKNAMMALFPKIESYWFENFQ